ncbi:MAG TPA: efflux RND transporter periplasmic adaptor subunit [Rhodothermales bacterium]|nr:efflux RND transporter periplasmic adaptor subunit [Rhodothermales bacterium]
MDIQTMTEEPRVSTPRTPATTERRDVARLAGKLTRRRGSGKATSKRGWFIWAGVLVVAIGGYLGWKALQPQRVDISVVAYQRIGPAAHPLLRGSGYVTYPRSATVATTSRTPVDKLYFDEGEHVRAGQVLAEFNHLELDAQRRAQLALLADARASLARTQSLHDAGAASEVDLQRAQAAVTQAQSSLNLTEAQLATTTVRAPFSGLVTRKLVEVGEIAVQGICTIVDDSKTLVAIDVSQEDISRIGPGQPAVVTLDAYPDVEYAALVVERSPTADQSKNTVEIRLQVLQPDARFEPQLSAKVFFVSDSVAHNQPVQAVLAADESAVISEGAQHYVWLLSDGRAVRKQVEIGRDLGDQVEILGGLRENDQVVAGADDLHLREGERIAPKQAV